jgi:hypothetical protein
VPNLLRGVKAPIAELCRITSPKLDTIKFVDIRLVWVDPIDDIRPMLDIEVLCRIASRRVVYEPRLGEVGVQSVITAESLGV